MGNFTTLTCDRCQAHFPLAPDHFGERPTHKVRWALYGLPLKEYDLCDPCRSSLNDTIKVFMENRP